MARNLARRTARIRAHRTPARSKSNPPFLSASHDEWNELIETGRAKSFLTAVRRLAKPVVINWGFPTRYLYIVSALQAEGVQAWWLHAERTQARAAFIARGGIDPQLFDWQMDNIERERLLISSVFGERVVAGLGPDGSQRRPEDLWSEITRSSY